MSRLFLFLPLFKISFDLAEYTANVDGVGTLRLLDAIKTCGLANSVKFYQASTSELYGKVQEIPQKETTPFYPRSPYGNTHLKDPHGNTHKDSLYSLSLTVCQTLVFGHVRTYKQRFLDASSPLFFPCTFFL